jgi:5-methylcytosine-specific restriction protein A
MEMTILFCNVGWMHEYNGCDTERPERGGAFNEDKIGHEVFNFNSHDGYVYGYVRSPGQIHIEKLGASSKDNQLDNVTVVWLAGPPGGGTAVIGWYLNATVFRDSQLIPNPDKKRKKLGMEYYRIRAKAEDAILLSVDQRRLLVPRGKNGIGQSNVWYAKKPESQRVVQSVLKLIEDGAYLSPIPDVDDNAKEGHSVTEGNARLSSHIRRERNQKIIKLKKADVLKKTKMLACEACGFDFNAVYGEHGQDFCEVHHIIPLSKADGIVETRLEDLAIVCSNCHRIIHRSDPILTINQLSKIIKSNQQ